jgi:hypothetical protein
MSHPHDSGAHPRAENDHVDSRSVLLVGFGALAIFILAGAATVGWIRHSNAATPQAALPAEVGQSKIGLVEQQLFDTNLRGARDRAARQAHLDSYGWVDHQAGVLHIPIDQAMALVAQGVRVPAGQLPLPPPLGAVNGGVDAPGATPAAAPAAARPAPAATRPPGGKRK